MKTNDIIPENFDDGKKPGRKGLAKRSGVDCKDSVTDLRKIAKNSTGERARMAHWCANMKSGRAKNESELTEGTLSIDVPNEAWLQDKIDYAKSKGRNSYGVPYMGSTTAAVRGTPPRVRVLRLASLPGMRNEQTNVRKDDLKWLMDYMDTHKKLPPMGSNPDEEYLPYIMVAWNGEAWVNEGNHRIMAAYRLNWPDMPIEIRYFDGGERIKTGPMYPGKIGLGEVDVPQTESVTEIFEPGKQNWKWKFKGSQEAFADFTVGDREYQWHAFSSEANPAKWEIQFRLVRAPADPDGLDLFGQTGTGNSAQVLSTAVDITRAFLQTYGLDKVEEITFNAKEDSRIDLYAKMIKRLLPTWELSNRKSQSYGMQFTLTDPRAYDKPENKITEKIDPDILHPDYKFQQKIGKFNYTASSYAGNGGKPMLKIEASDKVGTVGHAYFTVVDDSTGGHLESLNTYVHDDFQKKNIATTMYTIAKMLGNDIKPSSSLLPGGQAMWKSWKKSGDAKHLANNESEDLTEAEATGWTALEVIESILGKDRVTADEDELVQGMYYVYESNSPPAFEDTEEPGQTGGAIRLHDLEGSSPKDVAEAAHEACHAYAHSKSTSGVLYTNEKIINNLAEIWLKKNLSGANLHFALEHILGSKLHYGPDHMPRSVAEARTNPDQSTRHESGMKELAAVAKTIADPENWAISMTAEPKLGINPQVGISEDTPKGIYFYPLNYALDKTRYGKLPWGNDYPYIQLFQYDRSGEMTKETQVDPAKLKQALSQYCPEEVIQSAIDEPEYDGTPYWFIYDCLSRLGKSDETNIVRWNKVLRDLGFTSVYDDGAGWIAYNEPTQGVVLDPRVIKQLKTITNKKQSGVVTPAVIERAIFETMDMELAANRAWQAYDPDGSKLKAAAKEYAKKPEFKQYYGKPGSEEIFDKAESWGRYGARQLSQEAYEWFKEQQAQKTESVIVEGGWASTETQNTVITPRTVAEIVHILDGFEASYNAWQKGNELDTEIKIGSPKGSGTYYRRDLEQDPEREYGDVDVECFIHSREGIGSAQRVTEYRRAIKDYCDQSPDFSTDNGTNVIMRTTAGPVQVDLIYTFHEHADWSRVLSPEYRVKGVISTSLTSALAEALNLSFSSQGIQVKIRNNQPVSFRQSKDTELRTVTNKPETWAQDVYALYYYLSHGEKPAEMPRDLRAHGGFKDEQRLSDIVLSIKALAAGLEEAGLLGHGSLIGIPDKKDLIRKVAQIYSAKLEAAENSSKFDKAATPAAVEKAKKTKLMLAKYRNEVTKLLLN